MFALLLFFILVLEALSREFRTGELEHKDLRVDMRKEKYLHLRLNQST